MLLPKLGEFQYVNYIVSSLYTIYTSQSIFFTNKGRIACAHASSTHKECTSFVFNLFFFNLLLFMVRAELYKIAEAVSYVHTELGRGSDVSRRSQREHTHIIVFRALTFAVFILRCNQKAHFIALNDGGGKPVCGTASEHADIPPRHGFFNKFLSVCKFAADSRRCARDAAKYVIVSSGEIRPLLIPHLALYGFFHLHRPVTFAHVVATAAEEFPKGRAIFCASRRQRAKRNSPAHHSAKFKAQIRLLSSLLSHTTRERANSRK